MSRLGKNIGANLAANAWATVLSLALTPIYVSWLGVESYGLIGFYMSWLAIVGILDTGISATAMRELAWLSARPAERGQIGGLIRTLEAVYWGVIVALGAALFALAWGWGGDWFQADTLSPAALRSALMLMSVSLVVQIPSGLYLGGLSGLQRQVEAAALVALFGTMRGVGALAVLAGVGTDIHTFFAWQILASVAQTLTMRQVLWRTVPRTDRSRVSGTVLRSAGQFAGGMTLITALGVTVTQMDKVVLSRLVGLDTLGLYTLAWTVASGLSRVAAPLMQAFNARFTELASSGSQNELARHVRLANQLMTTLVLPPAALLVLLPAPILNTWLGGSALATAAAPLLSTLTLGTLLGACSYPALGVLYAQKRLKPVLVVNLVAAAAIVPLLIGAVNVWGVVGAAYCWTLYGAATFLVYQTAGLRLIGVRVVPVLIRDCAVPALTSMLVAMVTLQVVDSANNRVKVTALVAAALAVGWAAALLVCRDLPQVAYRLSGLKFMAADSRA